MTRLSVLCVLIAVMNTSSVARAQSAVDQVARPTGAARTETHAGDAFHYAYDTPRSPALQPIFARVREIGLWQKLPELQALDGMFLLPRHLSYTTSECGEFGAFYLPSRAEVVLCYETLQALYERGTAQQSGRHAGYALNYMRANVRFIVLHETGHALIDLLDLPATGRQEDAADQIAAILLLRFAGTNESSEIAIENLRMAADWMLSNGTGAYSLHALAGEHALGEQRYFNLQCLIYGTNPSRYAGMVVAKDLSPSRAENCPREVRRVMRSWGRLLMPHVVPTRKKIVEEVLQEFG